MTLQGVQPAQRELVQGWLGRGLSRGPARFLRGGVGWSARALKAFLASFRGSAAPRRAQPTLQSPGQA